MADTTQGYADVETEHNVINEPSLDILKDLQHLYENRIKLVQANGRRDKLEVENKVLRSWVQDLSDQNSLLVRTVEHLESEAVKRIRMLEQRAYLEQRKHSEIVSELQTEKSILQEKVSRKDSDLRGLVEILRRIRELDYCSTEGIHFYEVTDSDVYGSMEDCTKARGQGHGDKPEGRRKKSRYIE